MAKSKTSRFTPHYYNKKLLLSHEMEKIDNERRAIENIKSNPKHFFAYAKKKLKNKSKVGPFKLNREKN